MKQGLELDHGRETVPDFFRFLTGQIYHRSTERWASVGMKRLRSSEWAYVDDESLAFTYDELIAKMAPVVRISRVHSLSCSLADDHDGACPPVQRDPPQWPSVQKVDNAIV